MHYYRCLKTWTRLSERPHLFHINFQWGWRGEEEPLFSKRQPSPAEVPSLNVEPGKVLFNAVGARNLELVKLLRHGANPDITRDIGSYNVTLWAAELGLSDIVEALLDGGADPNFADANGLTPLSLAAEKGHIQAVEVLLGHSASVEIRDSVWYWKPLDWAVYAEKTDVMDILQALTQADYF
ncbi:ankyrin repeat-containing domain protein [Aspergillus keveii]|uniref:Ankyrin repeat-containing domain protein n=1 Tax=Aspergillus keveii TaxID=714993 RepID=A0ABR4FLJ3_9EURO